MKEFIKSWVKDIAIAVVIGAVILQVIKPTIVSGQSMRPTLEDHDYLFLSKQAYSFGEPHYGDIVVFRSSVASSAGSDVLWIKRVIGLPGDSISIFDGVVYRNGEPLDEEYTLEGYTIGALNNTIVPEDSLFVVGDNRQDSRDSRDMTVGCISMESVVGKAVFRLYPLDKIGFI